MKSQIEVLNNFIKEVETDLDEQVLRIDVNSSWNICTIFGFLLGFPVVYYFDIKNANNCLNNQDLIVYKVGVNNFSPISFSIPRILEPECKDVLDSWVQDMKVKISSINPSINISHTCVNLPVVSL